MLIVAPSGRTKEETSRDTPSFSWLFFMLTGSAAALEQVVKAISIASLMPRKNCAGVWPPQTLASVE